MTAADGFYIGVMSGTSLDAIDVVLLECGNTVVVHATHNHELPEYLRQDILALCEPGINEIDRAGYLHRALGELFAEAVLTLLANSDIAAEDIQAIGLHGQTIRHRPGLKGFSLQLGCADVVVERTGIAVVTDFRNRDMVLGGQGAPLVPAFHRALWGSRTRCAVVNIGGMANITLISEGDIETGFDTGPGNVLLDAWIQQHQKKACDLDGRWAQSGNVQHDLLSKMLDEPYFRQPAPKSTGRELFNLSWLQAHVGEESSADVQATLLELTATTIASSLNALAPTEVLICGGGARNTALMQRLTQLMEPVPVNPTDSAGLAAEWVEGAAFAWLAWARLAGIPGNAIRVTGAHREAVLGALYLP
ncbi:MAG: anhydro-N-acetylmuramic acid kinase [Gammaproteobacteria bacterium HGW-Gammaproteobacteria-14]|nr:MAG: anhydro-N-acetylmuramic acid kinase [Gammaproteobacteria bacterium HGW-Gammaproteobacteria-14]